MPDPDLRGAILDATRRLLVRDGYAGLSMRKIARALGYSATAIYLHFENKDALFHALIDEGMARLYGTLQAAVDPDAAPPERLAAVCRAYVRFGRDNPELYEVMFMLHPEHMARYPAEKYRRARRSLDLLAEMLSEGAASGTLEAPAPRVAASAVWAMLHGAVSLVLARRVDVRIDDADFVDAVVAQTVRGVLPAAQLDARASA